VGAEATRIKTKIAEDSRLLQYTFERTPGPMAGKALASASGCETIKWKDIQTCTRIPAQTYAGGRIASAIQGYQPPFVKERVALHRVHRSAPTIIGGMMITTAKNRSESACGGLPAPGTA